MSANSGSGRLDAYRRKRSAARTPEPFGGAAVAASDRPCLFVVHKHSARRLHYDLRLEWKGTLRSWAVPRGPSLDPAEKRLAVEVEDHPVEYADFEGVIPDGNYGAGPTIVWDRGLWVPLEPLDEAYAKGKLLFELRGYKLRGVWTLVRTKGKQKDWLLIKKPDGHAAAEGTRPFGQESVLSGLTIEDLAEGRTPADAVREALARRRPAPPRRRVRPADVTLQLAELAERPFSAPGWLFELKWDGFRLLAARDGGQAALHYRRGADSTHVFPELATALASMRCDGLVLDGEVVVLDEEGRPSFQRLQRRVQLTRPADIARASVEQPATYFAFDLLAFEGWDTRPLPLAERKALLARLLPPAGPIRYCDHVEAEGEALFEEVKRMGLEGVIAKRADRPYRGGRSDDWLKLRVERTADLVVVGYTQPKRTRAGFGALHLAVWDGAGWLYAGRVGAGFSDAQLAATRARLDEMRLPAPPCRGPAPRGREHVWVEPRLVVEVRYLEWTEDELLRQPVFLRFRDDKRPEECTGRDLASPAAPRSADAPADAPAPAPAGVEKKLVLSNLDKVFWPDDGTTKGDLFAYYRAVADAILPYLRDRPVVLMRFPDGIAGKSFFQQDAPAFVPGWLRTERSWSEDAGREKDYFVLDDVESLLYVVNLGTIPLHVWASRIATVQRPDWCILDLDPKGAPFAHVVKVANTVRALCEEIELDCYVKTSGSSGLHVLVPLGAQLTFEQTKTLGELLAHVVVARLPDLATVARAIPARGGRVYVDFLQNGHGKLLAAPLCVRPLPGAPVSTPLRWSEVGSRLDPRRFTIRTVPRRLARLGDDPLRPVLDVRPDLAGALERLSERLRSASG